jgi:hypothetical protein
MELHYYQPLHIKALRKLLKFNFITMRNYSFYLALFFTLFVFSFAQAQIKFTNITISVKSNGPMGESNGPLLNEIKDLCVPFTCVKNGEKLGIVPVVKLYRIDRKTTSPVSVITYEYDWSDKLFSVWPFYMIPPFTKQKIGIQDQLIEFKCNSDLAAPVASPCRNIPTEQNSNQKHVFIFSKQIVATVQNYISNCKKSNLPVSEIVIIYDQCPKAPPPPSKKTIFVGCNCTKKFVEINYVLKTDEYATVEACKKANSRTIYFCVNGKCISKVMPKCGPIPPGGYLTLAECQKVCLPPSIKLRFNGAQGFSWVVSGYQKNISKYTFYVDYAKGYTKQTCTNCGAETMILDITNLKETSVQATNVENSDHPGKSEASYRWDVTIYAKDAKGNVIASDKIANVKILCNHGGK